MYEQNAYRAEYVRTIDGDTVVLKVDLGFRIVTEQVCRLYGINTPERHEPGWEEARTALVGVMTEAAIHEYPITVQSKKPKDKYGRWLVTIYILKEPTQNLNEWLVQEGFAKRYG